MDLKFKLLLGLLGAIVLLVLGHFALQTYQTDREIKNANVAHIQKTAATAPTPATVAFQPEGQMLTQAINAKQASAAQKQSAPASSSSSAAPDHPITADPKAPSYSYDPAVCQKDGAPYLCLASFYEKLTSNYGASVAITDIKQRSNQNSVALADCHPLMHAIGRTASQSYPTVAEAFQHGDVYCWSGYYHGIMEGMVLKIGLKNLPTQLNSICSGLPGKASYNFEYYNCVHGLGHGVMAQLGDEVFDSLKMCDNLTGNWEQQSCYSGVFMQNIIDNTNVADTANVVKYLKPSDPLYPCDAVGQPYKAQCYLGQTSYALQITNYDFSRVFTLCAGVDQPYRDICNQSIGRDAANQALHNAHTTKATCALASQAQDLTNCVIGAVKEIISYYHSESQALDFCNLLDGTDHTVCSSTADAYYRLF